MGQTQSVPENAIGTVEQSASKDYRILDQDELYSEIEQIASKVSEFTALPLSTSKILLNSFRWDSSELITKFHNTNRDSFLREHHITMSTVFTVVTNRSCCVCRSEDYLQGKCYRSYVEAKMNEQQWLIKCPGNNCDYLTQDHVFYLVTNQRSRALYKKAMIESYVRVLKAVKQCPTVNCSCRWQSLNPDVSNFVVNCRCNNTFCFQCSTEDHWPATCSMMTQWFELESMEDPSEKWFRQYSKKCPNCQSKIEKNGGCDHMTCKRCSHQFCWICLDPRKGDFQHKCYLGNRTSAYGSSINQLKIEHYKSRLDSYNKLKAERARSLTLNAQLNATISKAEFLFRWLLWLRPQDFQLSTLRTAIAVLARTRQMFVYCHVHKFFDLTFVGRFISAKNLEESANQLEKLIESRILNLKDETLNSKLDESIAIVQANFLKFTGRRLVVEN